jgi:hypothetical protein
MRMLMRIQARAADGYRAIQEGTAEATAVTAGVESEQTEAPGA